MKSKLALLISLALCEAIQNVNAQAWNLNGNSGTNATDNFIGTIDNKQLKIRTNNAVRMTFSTNGKVGIGTTSPAARLHIKGTSNGSQLIIDAGASQTNSQPLIRLRYSAGFDLMHIHSDDSTNIFIGVHSGEMNDTTFLSWDGTRNTFIGCHAGADNSHGWENTAVGSFSLANNTSGALNTAVGYNALTSNTTAWSNTAIGNSALEFNTTGQGNTGCGFRPLNQNSTGHYNTALGYQVLFSNNGDRNSGFGYEALLYNISGAYNTAGGYYSMYQNTGGSINTAYGHLSLYSNTTANYNTATGHQALYFNNGDGNSAHGLNALYHNTSGIYNTASGYQALFNNTSGNYNVAMGCNTSYNSNGTYNTAIGTDAGCNNGTGPSNFTALGNNAGHVGSGSNTVEIGNASVSWIGGNVGWSTYSDRRIKENIQSNVPGLSFINKLNPVTYNLNIHKQNNICGINDTNEWEGKYDIEKIVQTGFLAQEVEQAAKECNYDFNGVLAPKGNAKLYSIQYAAFVVPLVKAVQEQQQQIEKLTKQMTTISSILTDEQKQQLNVIHGNKTGLEQNIPNPFNKSTLIKCTLPEKFSSALLKIYSSSGVEMKSYPLMQSGKNEITVAANTLPAGIYSYTLIVDDSAFDVKQMIVTK